MVRVHELVTQEQRGATLQCEQGERQKRTQGAVDILGQDTVKDSMGHCPSITRANTNTASVQQSCRMGRKHLEAQGVFIKKTSDWLKH